MPAHGFFETTNESASINELEILAALYRLQSFVKVARKRRVLLITDSVVTDHICTQHEEQFATSLASFTYPSLAVRGQRSHHLLRHILSVLNVWADRLSRRRNSTEWGLLPTATKILLRRKNAQFLDGEGLSPPGTGQWGRQPLVAPRLGLLTV